MQLLRHVRQHVPGQDIDRPRSCHIGLTASDAFHIYICNMTFSDFISTFIKRHFQQQSRGCELPIGRATMGPLRRVPVLLCLLLLAAPCAHGAEQTTVASLSERAGDAAAQVALAAGAPPSDVAAVNRTTHAQGEVFCA